MPTARGPPRCVHGAIAVGAEPAIPSSQPAAASPRAASDGAASGVVGGAAVGGAFAGVADFLAAWAGDGLAASPAARLLGIAVAAMLLGLVGLVAGLPWALALSRLRGQIRIELAENPRWWGFPIGAAAVAGLSVAASPGALGPAWGLAVGLSLIALAVAAVVNLRSPRARMAAVFLLMGAFGVRIAAAERRVPTDGWPPATATATLLVTVDGLGCADLGAPEAGQHVGDPARHAIALNCHQRFLKAVCSRLEVRISSAAIRTATPISTCS